jgi:hypothetical protein
MALATVLSVPANAHPGEVKPILTSRQLERRQAATNARHAVARNCDNEIRAFEAKRRAKRSALVNKRHRAGRAVETASATSTANEPTFTTLQNVGLGLIILISLYSLIRQTTCVLTPEADEGPYYIVRIPTMTLPVIVCQLMDDAYSTKNYFARILQTEWTVYLCYSMLVSWM